MVGGNRYGWFSTEEIPDSWPSITALALDCVTVPMAMETEGSDSRKDTSLP